MSLCGMANMPFSRCNYPVQTCYYAAGLVESSWVIHRTARFLGSICCDNGHGLASYGTWACCPTRGQCTHNLATQVSKGTSRAAAQAAKAAPACSCWALVRRREVRGRTRRSLVHPPSRHCCCCARMLPASPSSNATARPLCCLSPASTGRRKGRACIVALTLL
jgi:hypothetical protein